MADPAAEWYGLDLAREAGLKSGSLYPILSRLEEAGWLTGRWEDVEPSDAGRPRRRYYRLTPGGKHLATEVLANSPGWLVRWSPGAPA